MGAFPAYIAAIPDNKVLFCGGLSWPPRGKDVSEANIALAFCKKEVRPSLPLQILNLC
jgi:hypothetical protein